MHFVYGERLACFVDGFTCTVVSVVYIFIDCITIKCITDMVFASTVCYMAFIGSSQP